MEINTSTDLYSLFSSPACAHKTEIFIGSCLQRVEYSALFSWSVELYLDPVRLEGLCLQLGLSLH